LSDYEDDLLYAFNQQVYPQTTSKNNGAVRARELHRGYLPLVNTKSVTNVVKALEEIAEGKINIKEYLEKLQKPKDKNAH
jgi:hypothetical protein